MDIVVLASYANEGVPQSLLQAMAMARPVIGTTCGGIPEIVEIESNGLLVPPKDSTSLAEALLNLIRNPATRVKFGSRGLALVQERYSLEQMTTATEKVYAGIV
jgi:glycosyltransferase involved in cell wall biosynthesis